MRNPLLEATALVLGAAIYAYEFFVLLTQPRLGWAGRFLLALVVTSGSWYLGHFVFLYGTAAGVRPDSSAGVALKAVDLLAYLGGYLAWATGVCLSWHALTKRQMGFFWTLVVCAIISGSLTYVYGIGSAESVFATLPVPVSIAWFLFRKQIFGLLMPRRVLMGAMLGGFAALYMMAVLWASAQMDGWVSAGSQAFVRQFGEAQPAAGRLDSWIRAMRLVTRVAMLLAGVLVFVPLYDYFSRRTNRSRAGRQARLKQALDEAELIFDVRERLALLAARIAGILKFRTVALIAAGQPPAVVSSRPEIAPERDAAASFLERAGNTSDQLLPAGHAGYTHLLPLRAGGRVEGVMLIDASPRAWLDEDEPLVAALASEVAHSTAMMRLVDEKIALERELARQEHLAGLGRMAATIAHEFKNPLSSIKTISQLMLEDKEMAERYARDIGYILSESDRLASSVSQLLGFSRPIARAQGELDLSATVRAVAETLTTGCLSSGVVLEQNVEAGWQLPGATVELISQIVSNLGLNAIQASPPGARVRIALEACTRGARLSVSDEGPGIPPELRDRVFEPFYTTRQKGTGLGLAIVRKAVKHLDGDIRLESPSGGGKGVRFSIEFPSAARLPEPPVRTA